MQASMFMSFYTVAENSDTSYHDQQKETKKTNKQDDKEETGEEDCTQSLHHYTPLYDTRVIIILWGMLVKYEGSK